MRGAVQRSRIEELTVHFDDEVSFSPGAFTLQMINGPAIDVFAYVSLVNGKSVAQLVFNSGTVGGSLSDGRYVLTTSGAAIETYLGQHLDGDNEGTAGGDSTFNFHRYFGDADVDNTDLVPLREAFGSGASIFDYDGDGNTDVGDFVRFRERYGSMLP